MFEQLVNGVTQGSVYALLALGFTMIFGTLRMVTFAHGEVYMVGAYVGFELVRLFYPSFFLALVAALAATALLGVLIELLAFHFLRDAPHATSLLVTIGLSILLVNLAQLIWGPETQSLPYSLLDKLDYGEIQLAGAYISFLQIAVLAVTVLLMLFLYILINRTKLGMVIRATAQDYEAAYAMGVNINRIFAAAFAIGSMLGGVAGVLVGIYYNLFYPTMGQLYGLKAFSASVVGGLTSLPGAVVAGLLIGIVETFSVELGASNFRHMVSFLFMILILVLRPGGLFGGKELTHARGD
ncbi:MAG: branched-chain amino acid ABC transporter permease [Desulforhabdus sp.]|nr:branched-chain amino acid ABC transporter permease [Desulforhabdus sp.]